MRFFAPTVFTLSAVFITLDPAVSKQIPMPPGRRLVVGGEVVVPGEYPYFAHLEGNGPYTGLPGGPTAPWACGATLIAPDLVLAAGHCGNYTGYEVRVGATAYDPASDDNDQTATCVEWARHPGYNENLFGYGGSDYALCKLSEPVVIDKSRVVLELNDEPSVPFIGDRLVGVGLGATESTGPDVLRDVTLTYYANEECNAPESWDGDIAADQMCVGEMAGGKDLCWVDSGAPLVRKVGGVHTLVGLFSFVYVDPDTGDACGVPLKPGGYARIAWGMSWIRDVGCNELDSVGSFCVTPMPAASPTGRSYKSKKSKKEGLRNKKAKHDKQQIQYYG